MPLARFKSYTTDTCFTFLWHSAATVKSKVSLRYGCRACKKGGLLHCVEVAQTETSRRLFSSVEWKRKGVCLYCVRTQMVAGTVAEGKRQILCNRSIKSRAQGSHTETDPNVYLLTIPLRLKLTLEESVDSQPPLKRRSKLHPN